MANMLDDHDIIDVSGLYQWLQCFRLGVLISIAFTRDSAHTQMT